MYIHLFLHENLTSLILILEFFKKNTFFIADIEFIEKKAFEVCDNDNDGGLSWPEVKICEVCMLDTYTFFVKSQHS